MENIIEYDWVCVSSYSFNSFLVNSFRTYSHQPIIKCWLLLIEINLRYVLDKQAIGNLDGSKAQLLEQPRGLQSTDDSFHF